MNIEVPSSSIEQTQALAAALAQQLRGGDIVALEGELGAGKTVFVRGLAQGLGIDAKAVSSPTFVIRHEYEPPRNSDLALVHIDAYRLSGAEELETIGWSELIRQRDSIIAVEWPSRIAPALPRNRIDVTIHHVGASARAITIAAPDEMSNRLHGLAVRLKTAGVITEEAQTARAKCRKCGILFDRSAATFPFCSQCCRLADLGQWFREGYRVSRPMESDDELED